MMCPEKLVYKWFYILSMIDKKARIVQLILKNKNITSSELEKQARAHIDTYFGHRKINLLKTRLNIPVNMYMNIQIPRKAKKLSLKKVRILGHLFCDGWLRKKDFGYKNTNRELIDNFISDLRSIYGHKFSITDDEKKIRSISVGVKSIIKDLQRYGPFSSRNWKVPKNILNSRNKYWKRVFLGAIFDDEGTIDFSIDKKGYFRRRITMSLTSINALNNIQKLLLEFGISSKIYKLKKHNWYQLYIGGKSNMKKFSRSIKLLHNRKCENLEKLVRSYE